ATSGIPLHETRTCMPHASATKLSSRFYRPLHLKCRYLITAHCAGHRWVTSADPGRIIYRYIGVERVGSETLVFKSRYWQNKILICYTGRHIFDTSLASQVAPNSNLNMD